MFVKLGLLALVTPFVAGLKLFVPENPTDSGPVTLRWTSEPGDPATFSFELINESFNNAFAIANNVMPELGSIDIVLPVVPVGAGYTLQAVNIGNINEVYAETPQFAIGPNGATSVSSVSASRTTSGSSTSRTTLSVSATTRSTSTSAFGTTVTNPSTSETNSASQTSTSAPATFSNAAGCPAKMNTNNMGAMAAVLLSAVAGAVIVL